MNVQPTWLGIDVSQATFDAARAAPGQTEDLRAITVRRFPRTLPGVRACLDWTGLDLAGVAMESTGGYSRELQGGFGQFLPGVPVAVLNPAQVKAFGQSLGIRTKTDPVDARVIACFAAERHPKAAWTRAPVHEALRQLTRQRVALVEMEMAQRLRMKAWGEVPQPLAQVHAAVMEALKQGIRELDRALAKEVSGCDELKQDVILLTTIPGVGRLTAVSTLGALGDLRRFNRGRQLSAFAGVSPRQRESGTSVHGRTRMCKQGSAFARRALYMAAMTACRDKGPLGALYRRLVARGKARRAALGVLMRKLLLLMRAVLISGQPYQPSFKA